MFLNRAMRVTALAMALLLLAACAPETERIAESDAFKVLYRIEYSESAGFSALTPYQWAGLELEGCVLLVPPGSTIFDLLSSSETPTLSVYDAKVYEGDSTLVALYEEGMGADEWVEKALTGEGAAKSVTSMTTAGKDSAAGLSNTDGNMTYIGAYVSRDMAVLCVLNAPSAYVSQNVTALFGAEKDLASMAKSLVNIPLVPKDAK